MFGNSKIRNYGLFLALALIALGILFHIFHGTSRYVVGSLFFVVGPAFIYRYLKTSPLLTVGSFWKNYRDTLIIAAIGATIYGIFVYILNGMIDGSYLVEVQHDAIADIERRGLDGQAYDDAVKLSEALSQPLPFALTVSMQLWLGFAVLALPLVAFLRRKVRTV